MSDINNVEQQEQQTLYTQNQVDQLLREFSRRIEFEKQRTEDNNELEFPLEIINQLENTTPYQLQENFRKFKRKGIKYTPQRMDNLLSN
jgi:hypothetical protein